MCQQQEFVENVRSSPNDLKMVNTKMCQQQEFVENVRSSPSMKFLYRHHQNLTNLCNIAHPKRPKIIKFRPQHFIARVSKQCVQTRCSYGKSVCPTDAGTVSQRMPTSSQSLTSRQGHHSDFFRAPPRLQNSKGHLLSGGVKYTGVGKIAIVVLYLGNGTRETVHSYYGAVVKVRGQGGSAPLLRFEPAAIAGVQYEPPPPADCLYTLCIVSIINTMKCYFMSK